MSFRFWHRWLVIASVVFGLFGAMAALFPFSAPFALRNAAISDVFFAGTWRPEMVAYHAFSSGPLGGTIAGFYVLQTFVAAIPFGRRERWAWQAIVYGTIVWFLIDSGVSLWHGAAFNVYMINVVPLVVFGLPLVATSRAFLAQAGRVQR